MVLERVVSGARRVPRFESNNRLRAADIAGIATVDEDPSAADSAILSVFGVEQKQLRKNGYFWQLVSSNLSRMVSPNGTNR